MKTIAKEPGKLAKNMGLLGIGLCALCCALPIIGIVGGAGILATIALYAEKIAIVLLIISAASFAIWQYKRKQTKTDFKQIIKQLSHQRQKHHLRMCDNLSKDMQGIKETFQKLISQNHFLHLASAVGGNFQKINSGRKLSGIKFEIITPDVFFEVHLSVYIVHTDVFLPVFTAR